MKNILFALLLLPALVNAEAVRVDKTVVCTKLETMLTEISVKYKESAVWIGNKEKSQYVLAMNPTTTTWSLIEYDDKIACLIDTGVGSQIRIPGQKK
jgi:hypothetical protein